MARKQKTIAQMLQALHRSGMTLQQIADQCGFASRGHVHNAMRSSNARMSWGLVEAVRRAFARAS